MQSGGCHHGKHSARLLAIDHSFFCQRKYHAVS